MSPGELERRVPPLSPCLPPCRPEAHGGHGAHAEARHGVVRELCELGLEIAPAGRIPCSTSQPPLIARDEQGT
jgi:hypothetical protein